MLSTYTSKWSRVVERRCVGHQQHVSVHVSASLLNTVSLSFPILVPYALTSQCRQTHIWKNVDCIQLYNGCYCNHSVPTREYACPTFYKYMYKNKCTHLAAYICFTHIMGVDTLSWKEQGSNGVIFIWINNSTVNSWISFLQCSKTFRMHLFH